MTAAEELTRSVGAWLGGLDAGQRERATYPFDSPERSVWDYRPGERGGLALADMSTDQRHAAMTGVRAALSERGAAEVASIIALEAVLGALERERGRDGWICRDPERYWFAVFGEPAAVTPWSWRVGGHHVAIQLTVADDSIVGSAPSFLGANPAVVPSGPTAGQRALSGEEELARALVDGLSTEQRAIAIVDPVAPPDILSGNGRGRTCRRSPPGFATTT